MISSLESGSVSLLSLSLYDGEFAYEEALLTSVELYSGELYRMTSFRFRPSSCQGQLFHLAFHFKENDHWVRLPLVCHP